MTADLTAIVEVLADAIHRGDAGDASECRVCRAEAAELAPSFVPLIASARRAGALGVLGAISAVIREQDRQIEAEIQDSMPHVVNGEMAVALPGLKDALSRLLSAVEPDEPDATTYQGPWPPSAVSGEPS